MISKENVLCPIVVARRPVLGRRVMQLHPLLLVTLLLLL